MSRGDVLVPQGSAVLASTRDTTISSATSIVLNKDTKGIEVIAENTGVFLKFAAGVTTSDNGFDSYILPFQTRHYPVSGGSTISVIEAATGGVATVIQFSSF